MREVSFEHLKESLEKGFDRFIFASNVMGKINEEITRVAQMDGFTILLTGETGVGKDVVAMEIHRRSKRKDRNFVIVSLAEINQNIIESEIFGYEKGAFTGAERRKLGRFELSNGGTLYLAEISDIPSEVQVKLLRFLQYRTIVRIGGTDEIKLSLNLIMATNQDIEKLNREGKLRDDFYHRIKVFRIHIPPLRERKKDIPALTDYFLSKFSLKYYGFGRELKVSDDVIDLFLNYSWPGNVKELSNVIESAVLRAPLDSDELTVKDFPSLPNQAVWHGYIKAYEDGFPDFKTYISNARKYYIENLLRFTGGDLKKASEISGLTIQGIRKILRR